MLGTNPDSSYKKPLPKKGNFSLNFYLSSFSGFFQTLLEEKAKTHCAQVTLGQSAARQRPPKIDVISFRSKIFSAKTANVRENFRRKIEKKPEIEMSQSMVRFGSNEPVPVNENDERTVPRNSIHFRFNLTNDSIIQITLKNPHKAIYEGSLVKLFNSSFIFAIKIF